MPASRQPALLHDPPSATPIGNELLGKRDAIWAVEYTSPQLSGTVTESVLALKGQQLFH